MNGLTQNQSEAQEKHSAEKRSSRVPPRNLPSFHTGQALVPVIFVLLILTVVGVAFGVSAHRSAQAANNYVTQMQRFYAAKGAVNYSMSALAHVSNNGSTYGIVPPLPDTDGNGWTQVGDTWVKIDTIDTGAFINLNNVTETTLNLMPVFQNNTDLAQAIIQWRTPTSAQTGTTGAGGSTGAASSAGADTQDPYQSLPMPYAIKGTNYDTVEELLLIQGMSPTILYGSAAGTPIAPLDAESNPATTAGSPGATSSSGSSSYSTGLPRMNGTSRSAQRTRQSMGTAGAAGTTGTNGTTGGTTGTGTTAATEDFSDIYNNSQIVLAQLFTTVGREINVMTDGTPRVNINTATAQDLQNAGLTAAQANAIVSFRTAGTAGVQGAGGGNRPGQGNGQGNRPGNGQGNGQGNRPGGNGQGNGQGNRPFGGGNGGGPPGGGPGGPPGGGFNGGRPGGGGAGGRFRSASESQWTRQAAAVPGGGGALGNAGGGGNIGGNRPGGGGGGNGGTAGTGAGGTGTGSTTQTYKTIADLLEVSAFTRTVMQSVADKLSVDSKVFHEGLVNINTAPPEVLATVPGMTHNIMNAILNYRQGGQYFQDLGDLFSIQDLQRPDFQAVIANLTTRTTTYYVRVKVRTSGQQSVYAVSALVELSDAGPRLLQWREVPRAPGWSTWITAPTLPAPTPGQNSVGSTSTSSAQ